MFSLANTAMDPPCSFLLLLHSLIRSLSSQASQPWGSFSFWLFPVISLCGPQSGHLLCLRHIEGTAFGRNLSLRDVFKKTKGHRSSQDREAPELPLLGDGCWKVVRNSNRQ